MQKSKNGQMSYEELEEFRKDLDGTSIHFIIDYVYEDSFPNIHPYYVHNFKDLFNPESFRGVFEKDLSEKIIEFSKKAKFNIQKYQETGKQNLNKKDHEKIFKIYNKSHEEMKIPYYKLLGCSLKE